MRFLTAGLVSLGVAFATPVPKDQFHLTYDSLLASIGVDLTEEEIHNHRLAFNERQRLHSMTPMENFMATLPVQRSSMISYVNELGGISDDETGEPLALWTADKSSRFQTATFEQAKRLCGTFTDNAQADNSQLEAPSDELLGATALPTNFDARTKFTTCKNVLGHIADQGQCGSCWAVSSTSAVSDRTCIASSGKSQVQLSAEHTMSCCNSAQGCQSLGCDGGYPSDAFQWYTSKGVVTGNESPNTGTSCWPYTSPTTTPVCAESACHDTKYKNPFKLDRHFGNGVVELSGNIQAMKTEIFNNGPIVAGFDVYEDFMSYSSGIYHHVTGDLLGGHAVRILGWGVQGKTNYWLVANSWGTSWGIAGTFMIKQGDCNFEQMVSTVKVNAPAKPSSKPSSNLRVSLGSNEEVSASDAGDQGQLL